MDSTPKYNKICLLIDIQCIKCITITLNSFPYPELTLNNNAYSSHDAEVAAGIKGGICATYIRQALEAGGINTYGHPRWAAHYGRFLSAKGFSTISLTDYVPDVGDIRVWQPYSSDKTPYGHIDMYNGTLWISDFKENSFYPGKGYRNDPIYQIYRWPGQ